MTKEPGLDWPAGRYWRNHFRASLLDKLETPRRDAWAAWERAVLGPSLAQFQLGESSDGRHLLDYARRFGERTGDAWLAEAVALFIQEENRHSRWLGEFLKAQGYPLLRAHWIDDVFRVMRKPMGFGLMAAVLVCAEIVAVPYYSAVRRATSSQWLQAICDRILHDEAQHLRFQSGNLGAVWRRWKLLKGLRGAHRLVLAVICLAAWREHRAVLRRGGFTASTFLRNCLTLLDDVHDGALSARETEWPESVSPAVR